MSQHHFLSKSMDLRLRMKCSSCGCWGRPLLRRYGMPPLHIDWPRHEREGRYRIMGCSLDESPAPYECRHCGIPTFVSDQTTSQSIGTS